MNEKQTKKVVISMCMGSSCFPRGNDENMELIRHYLKVHHLEHCVELKGHRCQDNCHLGPNIIVDGKQYTRANPGMFPAILRDLLPYFESRCEETTHENDNRGML
jgi:NADH:ubiquinone oxidoreductase subunit E